MVVDPFSLAKTQQLSHASRGTPGLGTPLLR
jgi:hypothetical protein